MKILAIEASGPVAGCAILDGDTLVGEFTIQNKKTHSQTLVPMMEDLKERSGCDLSEIDAIAITKGPGSFTGLRIGAATAKGVALALDKPMIAVPTVDSLAFNLFGSDALICPIMDARRGQVYTGIYEEKTEPVTIKEQCAMAVSDLCAALNDLQREVIFVGDGVPAYCEQIDSLLSVPHLYAPAHLSRQRAGSLAVLAAFMAADGGDSVLIPSDDFRPEYLRKSQAERQKEEAEQKGEMEALAAGRLVKDPTFKA